MSLFGSMLRDFDDDPFFSSHQDHIRRMNQVMGNIMDPFENIFGNMNEIMGIPRLTGPSQGRSQNPRREQGMVPFGFGPGFGFPSMRGMMTSFQHLPNDPNCHSYSSSSVMTYSTGEDGTPQVYQAAASTRRAPGGVKETRKTVCDTESGMKKMSIGHHLGEKAHIIEKTKFHSGQEEEAEEFINLAEEEAASFNQEWRRKVNPTSTTSALPALQNRSRRRHEDNPARTVPSSSRKRDIEDEQGGDKSRRKYKSSKNKQHKRDQSD